MEHERILEAIKFGDLDTIISILDTGFNIETRDLYGHTLLDEAIIHNKHDVLRLLLSRGANPNNNGKRTPLHISAERGNLESVKILLQCGADPFLVDGNGKTAKEAANFYYNGKIVQLLEEYENMPEIKEPEQL